MVMRASMKIANLEAEVERLTRINKVLRARAAAEEAEFLDEPPETHGDWADGLSPQETCFMAALRKAYPRALSKLDLLEAIPGQDHAADRQVQVVGVLASRIRTKKGQGLFENVKGFGFVLTQDGAEFVDAPNKGKVLNVDQAYSIPTSYMAGTAGPPYGAKSARR